MSIPATIKCSRTNVARLGAGVNGMENVYRFLGMKKAGEG